MFLDVERYGHYISPDDTSLTGPERNEHGLPLVYLHHYPNAPASPVLRPSSASSSPVLGFSQQAANHNNPHSSVTSFSHHSSSGSSTTTAGDHLLAAAAALIPMDGTTLEDGLAYDRNALWTREAKERRHAILQELSGFQKIVMQERERLHRLQAQRFTATDDEDRLQRKRIALGLEPNDQVDGIYMTPDLTRAFQEESSRHDAVCGRWKQQYKTFLTSRRTNKRQEIIELRCEPQERMRMLEEDCLAQRAELIRSGAAQLGRQYWVEVFAQAGFGRPPRKRLGDNVLDDRDVERLDDSEDHDDDDEDDRKSVKDLAVAQPEGPELVVLRQMIPAWGYRTNTTTNTTITTATTGTVVVGERSSEVDEEEAEEGTDGPLGTRRRKGGEDAKSLSRMGSCSSVGVGAFSRPSSAVATLQRLPRQQRPSSAVTVHDDCEASFTVGSRASSPAGSQHSPLASRPASASFAASSSSPLSTAAITLVADHSPLFSAANDRSAAAAALVPITYGSTLSASLRSKLLLSKRNPAPQLPVDLFGIHRLLVPPVQEYIAKEDAVDERSLSMGDGRHTMTSTTVASQHSLAIRTVMNGSASATMGAAPKGLPGHTVTAEHAKKHSRRLSSDLTKRLADAPRKLSLFEQFLDDRSHMRYLFDDGAQDIALTATRRAAQGAADQDFLAFNERRLRQEIEEEQHRIATTKIARDLAYSLEVSKSRSQVNGERRRMAEAAETHRRESLEALWLDDWQDLLNWLQQEIRTTIEKDECDSYQLLVEVMGPASVRRAQELDRIRQWMWMLWKAESQTRSSNCWKELDERAALEALFVASKK